MEAQRLSQRLKVYVYGGDNEWYLVDLESLPEVDARIYPVAKIKNAYRGTGDWAVLGDHIYWAGGIMEVEKSFRSGHIFYEEGASTKLFRHHVTTNGRRRAQWEVTCPFVKLPRHNARVFVLDNNIFVLGGRLLLHENEGDDIEKLRCEIYSIGTDTCDLVGTHLMDFIPDFSTQNTCLVRDKKGNLKLVIFYSFQGSYLLFYNVRKGTFRFQVHPDFGFDPYICPEGLAAAVMTVCPVVRNSTLYWFTYDLCLYGYNFIKQKWFRSQVLKPEELWELPHYHDGEVLIPILVDLYNGDFLLLARTLSGKLGIAFLDVYWPNPRPKSKPQGNFTELFKVTVKSCRTFCPTTDFAPRSAMAIGLMQYVGVQEAGAEAAYVDDDEGVGGLALNAQPRAMLMANLDCSGIASSIVDIHSDQNMFDPVNELASGMEFFYNEGKIDLDIKDGLHEECSR